MLLNVKIIVFLVSKEDNNTFFKFINIYPFSILAL